MLNSLAWDAKAGQLLFEAIFVSISDTHSARRLISCFLPPLPQTGQTLGHLMAGRPDGKLAASLWRTTLPLPFWPIQWCKRSWTEITHGVMGMGSNYSFTIYGLCGLGQVLNLFESQLSHL